MEPHFDVSDITQWAVAEIIDQEPLTAALSSGKPLHIKLGIDPTSPDIHLGRSLHLWRLRAFQELGHHIHFIIGDFTGQIGDTSDKEAERPMSSAEDVEQNMQSYLAQVEMILNTQKWEQVHIHYNSEWLSKLSFAEVSLLADVFSVNQFIKRELIAKRLESGSRISLREMLYPLMQGYDSVMVEAQVELGGTDQRFNMLAGRLLQEQRGMTPQAIIMSPLISGTDGRKMSSSWGNVIRLLDTPGDKFGKVMATRDELLEEYLAFLPRFAQPFTAEELRNRLAAGENPRDLKFEYAVALVSLYHGETVAEEEKQEFIQQFQKHELPEDIPSFVLEQTETVLEVLVNAGLATSRSDARILLSQQGIRLNGEVVTDELQAVKEGDLIQKGKRKFLRLI